MSQTQPTTTTRRPTLPADPFADVGSDHVLRCQDPETGWQWFYDRDGGQVFKYHERDDYEPEPTAECIVAATLALDSIGSCSVSEVYLEVYAEGESV